MPSRWYHSRIFTFGLAGLVILLIAWAVYPRSTLTLAYDDRRGSSISFTKSPHATGFRRNYEDLGSSRYHELTFFKGVPAPKNNWLWKNGWDAVVHDYQKEDRYRPGYFSSPVYYRPDETRWNSLFIANWAIVTGYAILWLGSLTLWQRRKHRLMRPQGMTSAQRP